MKQIILASACALLFTSASGQNADPVVNIQAGDASILVANTTTVSVDAGNFGANAIAAASLELSIRAGNVSEITGIPNMAGTKWTLFSTTSGSHNAYVFRNS